MAIAVVAGCASKPHDADFAGLVDIGAGRALYLNCQGSGSPTVFIIPGKGSYAEVWNVVVPADDPIRSSPYDIIGQANLEPSPTATQPTVAKMTRVCAYDRPNTRSDGADRSTPVPQPHSIQQDVDDVVKLIAAAIFRRRWSWSPIPTADSLPISWPAHIPSWSVVWSSWTRRRSSYRDWVDPTRTPSSTGPRERRRRARRRRVPRRGCVRPHQGGATVADGADDRAQFRQVPAAGRSDADTYTRFQIHRANSLLAETLATENVIIAGSGHNLMLYEPQVVADKIVAIVDQVAQAVTDGCRRVTRGTN